MIRPYCTCRIPQVLYAPEGFLKRLFLIDLTSVLAKILSGVQVVACVVNSNSFWCCLVSHCMYSTLLIYSARWTLTAAHLSVCVYHTVWRLYLAWQISKHSEHCMDPDKLVASFLLLLPLHEDSLRLQQPLRGLVGSDGCWCFSSTFWCHGHEESLVIAALLALGESKRALVSCIRGWDRVSIRHHRPDSSCRLLWRECW